MIATCLVHIKTGRFPIIGWKPDRNSRIDALLVATAGADGTLRYVGTVEWGLSAPLRATLRDALRYLSRPDCPLTPLPPAASVDWVNPHLTLQVRFSSWTCEGLLRHPFAETVQLRQQTRS